MTITQDKVVSLIYELRVDSAMGEVIEAITNENPLTFIFGVGNLLPKFEEKITGLKTGDNFSFDLQASDAYGDVNEAAIVDVPVSAFMVDGKIDDNLVKIGNTIPMRDNAGNRLNGIVKEIDTENVKMDFNHPLAGNHLFFSGEVTEVRDATTEELTHGLHGESCSCNSSCGEGGSCGDGGSCGCGDGDGGCGC